MSKEIFIHFRLRKNVKYYRVNYQITAPQVRLLDDSGKQIGILARQDALRRAQAEEKDLVEIAGNASPPVVKLIDFKKFKYLEAKRERASRKNVKNVGVKQIRLSPFMGDHDFQVRVKQGETFLKEGNQLKITLPFRGREITHKEFGFAVIQKAIKTLESISKVVKPPFFEGRILVTVLSPSKQTIKTEDAKS